MLARNLMMCGEINGDAKCGCCGDLSENMCLTSVNNFKAKVNLTSCSSRA